MAYDLKKEEDVKEYLQNLSVEYRFECFHEKKPDGCHRLADFLEAVKKDFKKSAKIYQTNCDESKFALSCFKFGNYSFLGKGCQESPARALDYYKMGCSLDHPESCLHAGLMLTNPRDKKLEKNYKDGIGYFDRGCDNKNSTCCYFASGIYLSGNSDVPKDMKKAFEYSLKACDLGNAYACANLSQMYQKGDGTSKDEKLAEKYKIKALDMRNQMTKQQRTIEFEQGTGNNL